VTAAPSAPTRLPRLALALAVVGIVGVAISAYLTWTRLAGVLPICGPSGGCETVEQSPYSSVAGIPVAAFGILNSAAVVILALWWGRTRDPRAGYAAYALGLAGVLVEAYLVYLELFVIHAICLWCVAYGITIVLGLGLAVRIVRSQGRTTG
jgi:uncharacterized membrane protein